MEIGIFPIPHRMEGNARNLNKYIFAANLILKYYEYEQ